MAVATAAKTDDKPKPKLMSLWDRIRAILQAKTEDGQPVAARVCLYGMPGTGKTFAATQRSDGKLVYSVTCTDETPAAELRGHFIPAGEGKFIWHDGPAVRAWREGAVLVVNEIDRASSDLLSLLYAIMDDPQFARLTLPTGETVKPEPGFQVIATTNESPEVLPEALQSRLAISIHVDEVAPEAIEQLSPDLRMVAAKTTVEEDPERRIGLRHWYAFDDLRGVVGEDVAGFAVFGKRAKAVVNSIKVATA